MKPARISYVYISLPGLRMYTYALRQLSNFRLQDLLIVEIVVTRSGKVNVHTRQYVHSAVRQ